MKRLYFPTIVGIFVTIVLPEIASAFVGPIFATYSFTVLILINTVLSWGFTFLLFAIVKFWEKLPLDSIGLTQFTKKDLTQGLRYYLLGLVVIAVSGIALQQGGIDNTTQFAEVSQEFNKLPLLLLLLVGVTAGITEEVLYRGYLITRLATFTKNIYVSGVISYLLFVWAHLALWGGGKTLQVAVWSIIPTLLFIKTKRLWPCIVMHTANDIVTFLLIRYIPIPA